MYLYFYVLLVTCMTSLGQGENDMKCKVVGFQCDNENKKVEFCKNINSDPEPIEACEENQVCQQERHNVRCVDRGDEDMKFICTGKGEFPDVKNCSRTYTCPGEGEEPSEVCTCPGETSVYPVPGLFCTPGKCPRENITCTEGAHGYFTLPNKQKTSYYYYCLNSDTVLVYDNVEVPPPESAQKIILRRRKMKNNGKECTPYIRGSRSSTSTDLTTPRITNPSSPLSTIDTTSSLPDSPTTGTTSSPDSPTTGTTSSPPDFSTTGTTSSPDSPTTGTTSSPPDSPTTGTTPSPDSPTTGTTSSPPDSPTTGTTSSPPDSPTTGTTSSPDSPTTGTTSSPPDSPTTGTTSSPPDSPTTGTTSSPPDSPTTPTTVTTTVSTNPTTSLPGEKPKCNARGELYETECDCDYFKCDSNLKPVRHTCLDGLKYHHKMKMCVFGECKESECVFRNPPPPSLTTTNTSPSTSASTTPTTVPTSVPGEKPKCNARGELYETECDCDYFKCDSNLKPVRHTCLDGLKYHPKMRMCVFGECKESECVFRDKKLIF